MKETSGSMPIETKNRECNVTMIDGYLYFISKKPEKLREYVPQRDEKGKTLVIELETKDFVFNIVATNNPTYNEEMQIFKISDDFIKYYNSNPCIKKVYLKYDIWADSWNDEQQETYKECLELDKERKVVIMKSE